MVIKITYAGVAADPVVAINDQGSLSPDEVVLPEVDCQASPEASATDGVVNIRSLLVQ